MAQEWVLTVADPCCHGTTFPTSREEGLRPHHSQPPDRLSTVLSRKVAADCLVTLEPNRYSVPPAYVGWTVDMRSSPKGTVQI